MHKVCMCRNVSNSLGAAHSPSRAISRAHRRIAAMLLDGCGQHSDEMYGESILYAKFRYFTNAQAIAVKRCMPGESFHSRAFVALP